jgi:hypothetical protein
VFFFAQIQIGVKQKMFQSGQIFFWGKKSKWIGFIFLSHGMQTNARLSFLQGRPALQLHKREV